MGLSGVLKGPLEATSVEVVTMVLPFYQMKDNVLTMTTSVFGECGLQRTKFPRQAISAPMAGLSVFLI